MALKPEIVILNICIDKTSRYLPWYLYFIDLGNEIKVNKKIT